MTVKINGAAVVVSDADKILAEARLRAIARAQENVVYTRQSVRDAETRANIEYFFKTLRGPGVYK
jgi:hypothetical protein